MGKVGTITRIDKNPTNEKQGLKEKWTNEKAQFPEMGCAF
jgi:hypothetical protein